MEKGSNSEKKPASVGEVPVLDSPAPLVANPSYVSQLKIWNGSFSNQSFFKIFLRPIPLLFSPVVCADLAVTLVRCLNHFVDSLRLPGSWDANRVAEYDPNILILGMPTEDYSRSCPTLFLDHLHHRIRFHGLTNSQPSLVRS